LPVSPKPVVGKTSTLYWSTVDYIDGETIALLEPVNPEGYPFPTPGKYLGLKSCCYHNSKHFNSCRP
jgi:hypothetical protein